LRVNILYKCLVDAEDMLVAIASATGERIGIGQNRLTTIVAAGFDARHFTLDLSSTRIRSAFVPSLCIHFWVHDLPQVKAAKWYHSQHIMTLYSQ